MGITREGPGVVILDCTNITKTCPNPDLVRKMPCSLSSERALLGSILIDPSAITDILTVVQADDFCYQTDPALLGKLDAFMNER